MTRPRYIPALLLAAAMLAVCMPAHAQGNGNGNSPPDHAGENNSGGNGNSAGTDAGNNGSGGGSSSGNGASSGDENTTTTVSAVGTPPDNSVQPTPPARNAVNAANPPAATPPAEPTTLTPDATLNAVRSGEALPLDAIAAEVRGRSGAEIIDARLLRVGEVLVYAVKTLTTAGAVRTEYYYGRSGLRVE